MPNLNTHTSWDELFNSLKKTPIHQSSLKIELIDDCNVRLERNKVTLVTINSKTCSFEEFQQLLRMFQPQVEHYKLNDILSLLTSHIIRTDQTINLLNSKAENISGDHFPIGTFKNSASLLANLQSILTGNTKLTTKSSNKFEKPFRHKIRQDKEDLWLETNITPIATQENEDNIYLCVTKNISTSINTEWELLKSEAKFKSLFDNSPSSTIIVKNGNVILTNKTFQEHSGIKDINFPLTELQALVEPRDYAHFQYLSESVQNNKSFSEYHEFKTNVKTPSGENMWLGITIRPIIYESEDAYIAFFQDITDKINTENKLLKNVIQALDKERERYSHDLHDGLGQTLSALNMYGNTLKASLTNKEQLGIVEQINKLTERAIEETRIISHSIMPSSLKQFGLSSALHSTIDELNKVHGGLVINFKDTIKEFRFDPEKELSSYRIVLESLNNALKHSNASIIILELRRTVDKLLINIVDNGKGFDVQEAVKNGFGLNSIIKRTEVLGGSIEIGSEDKNGSKISITIPLNKY